MKARYCANQAFRSASAEKSRSPINPPGVQICGFSMTFMQRPQIWTPGGFIGDLRSEEHTSELQSLRHLVCRLLLEKKKQTTKNLSVVGLALEGPGSYILLCSTNSVQKIAAGRVSKPGCVYVSSTRARAVAAVTSNG